MHTPTPLPAVDGPRAGRPPRPGGRLVPLGLAAALSVGFLAGVPAVAQAATPQPALHYAFDASDVSSGVVADSSGNGYDGALVNRSTARSVDGAPGGGAALDLPGGAPSSDGAYVTVPRAVLAGAGDLTVSARVRWEGAADGPWQWIYALGKDNGSYLFSTPANGDGRLRTAVTTSGGGGEAQVTGSAALPADAWRTVTVTLDTAADRVTTYLDGAAVGSATTDATAARLLGDSSSAGFLGRSFYGDPLFAGALDDFTVYRSALSADEVAGLVAAPATLTSLTQTSVQLRTTVGTAPALPATLTGSFSDGYDRPVPVVWDAVDPSRYAAVGTFSVSGTAGGNTVTATVTVIRPGQVRIDLGTSTGAFHGGASGTLYGVYGAGVPTNNLIEGMGLRTVATKAQDGPQHPGADALDVVRPLADSTDGDVYIYMTDIHRGFPYQWPGDTPAEKLSTYLGKIGSQVDQVRTLPEEYQDNVVFVPFNEPEGNMFGTGEWSYDQVSWLSDPTDYFAAWDQACRLIRSKMPDARIAGPNTSQLFPQVEGFLAHTVTAGTVPDVMTWHELQDPESVRTNVARYRGYEKKVFAGTKLAGRELPINIDEYAFNYHTSVPGQMIQWISAIEESKVDADIAYWNIDGNLSDSAVQANRGNGQWWLYNAYASMSGHTVAVDPPDPGQNYTLQGVATLDEDKAQARALIGGAAGRSSVEFTDVPRSTFGRSVHAWVREIPWTGQIGDSGPPQLVAERDLPVVDGTVSFEFGKDLPALEESSAYEIVLTPAGQGSVSTPAPSTWQASYEAEDATYTGGGYSRNGPEGSPQDVSKFYTSGGFDVGGLRTGSDGVLDFSVDVPTSGVYDLSVFANSLNTYPAVQDQGPTNVFLRVDGAAEQQLYLPLGYKWVVWDHSDTTVRLSAGKHTLSLAARSLDGTRTTQGDAILDRVTLALPNPEAGTSVYEAELADLAGGARARYTGIPDSRRAKISGSGAVTLGEQQTATFWVYSAADEASLLRVDTLSSHRATVTVNGQQVGTVDKQRSTVAVSLSGGVNKVTLTGSAGRPVVDRIRVTPQPSALPAVSYEAEAATLHGTATAQALSLASGGRAVTGVGGAPGNTNTLTFRVAAAEAGTYAVRVRYANPEQAPATHYNPDPLARHADLTVNGRGRQRVLFPHSFHENNFWELTVRVSLKKGVNTLTFRSEELPDFDGTTYASQVWDVPLRSQYAPIVDKIAVAPFSRRVG